MLYLYSIFSLWLHLQPKVPFVGYLRRQHPEIINKYGSYKGKAYDLKIKEQFTQIVCREEKPSDGGKEKYSRLKGQKLKIEIAL